MYFFIADEHYGHANVIGFNDRPFADVEEMDEALIANHNSIVRKGDRVIHAGDTCWYKRYYDKNPNNKDVASYINRLNGTHVFLKGSHDYWMPKNKSVQIWEKMIDGHYLVVCHYAMHTWARSHFNSWHLYAHSHKDLKLSGKRHCISVENTNFFPLSFDQVKEIMIDKSDNPNFIKPEDRNHGK